VGDNGGVIPKISRRKKNKRCTKKREEKIAISFRGRGSLKKGRRRFIRNTCTPPPTGKREAQGLRFTAGILSRRRLTRGGKEWGDPLRSENVQGALGGPGGKMTNWKGKNERNSWEPITHATIEREGRTENIKDEGGLGMR